MDCLLVGGADSVYRVAARDEIAWLYPKIQNHFTAKDAKVRKGNQGRYFASFTVIDFAFALGPRGLMR